MATIIIISLIMATFRAMTTNISFKVILSLRKVQTSILDIPPSTKMVEEISHLLIQVDDLQVSQTGF